MPRVTSLAVATATALLLATSTTDAKPEFARLMPNGAVVPGTSALGHADGTGASDKLNPFGTAFDKAGLKWTPELCQADSDGDGQTNGQELGDPCCEWTSGATPKFSSGVSHPGDASSTVSAAVLASYTCGGAAAPAATPPAPAASSSSATRAASVGATVVVVAAATTAWTQW